MTLCYVDEKGNQCDFVVLFLQDIFVFAHVPSYLVLFSIDCNVLANVREDFVGYTNITGDTSGDDIADTVIERL